MGDLESCKDATDQLNIMFAGVVDFVDIPKGCYTPGDYVYFNVQTDLIAGSRKNGTHDICKATFCYPVSIFFYKGIYSKTVGIKVLYFLFYIAL